MNAPQTQASAKEGNPYVPTKPIQVVVATHKHYDFPPDPAYMPVQVGRSLATIDLGCTGDNAGDNISERNASYCELTATYWAWKNSPAEISGLVHYRRYFAGSGWRGVATSAEMESWLKNADVVIARPRRYFVETIRSHYVRAHYARDLEIAQHVIADVSPDYLDSFESVMAQRQMSLYNMMLARWESWDRYCQWIFPILDECYNRVPWQSYGPHQRRVIGFLAEPLLNVWVTQQRGQLRIVTRPVVQLEREPVITKGFKLLGRKFGMFRAD